MTYGGSAGRIVALATGFICAQIGAVFGSQGTSPPSPDSGIGKAPYGSGGYELKTNWVKPRLDVPEVSDRWIELDPMKIVTSPGRGSLPKQPTRVFAGYDRENFYALVYGAEPNTHNITRLGTRRDQQLAEDYVMVVIDPRNSNANARGFRVNVNGLQTDIAHERGVESVDFDAVWRSSVHIIDSETAQGLPIDVDEGGILVFYEIPFQALGTTFRMGGTNELGLQVVRRREHKNQTLMLTQGLNPFDLDNDAQVQLKPPTHDPTGKLITRRGKPPRVTTRFVSAELSVGYNTGADVGSATNRILGVEQFRYLDPDVLDLDVAAYLNPTARVAQIDPTRSVLNEDDPLKLPERRLMFTVDNVLGGVGSNFIDTRRWVTNPRVGFKPQFTLPGRVRVRALAINDQQILETRFGPGPNDTKTDTTDVNTAIYKVERGIPLGQGSFVAVQGVTTSSGEQNHVFGAEARLAGSRFKFASQASLVGGNVSADHFVDVIGTFDNSQTSVHATFNSVGANYSPGSALQVATNTWTGTGLLRHQFDFFAGNILATPIANILYSKIREVGVADRNIQPGVIMSTASRSFELTYLETFWGLASTNRGITDEKRRIAGASMRLGILPYMGVFSNVRIGSERVSIDNDFREVNSWSVNAIVPLPGVSVNFGYEASTVGLLPPKLPEGVPPPPNPPTLPVTRQGTYTLAVNASVTGFGARHSLNTFFRFGFDDENITPPAGSRQPAISSEVDFGNISARYEADLGHISFVALFQSGTRTHLFDPPRPPARTPEDVRDREVWFGLELDIERLFGSTSTSQ